MGEGGKVKTCRDEPSEANNHKDVSSIYHRSQPPFLEIQLVRTFSMDKSMG